MKITRKQLRKIIKEEKARILSEMTPADMGMAAARMDDQRRGRQAEHGVLTETGWESIIFDEIKDYLQSEDMQFLTPMEAKMIQRNIMAAANSDIMDITQD